MSPARTSLISSRWLACICTHAANALFLALNRVQHGVAEDATRRSRRGVKVRVPTNGSVSNLERQSTRPLIGKLDACQYHFKRSHGPRSTSQIRMEYPRLAGISVGAGRKSITASRTRGNTLVLERGAADCRNDFTSDGALDAEPALSLPRKVRLLPGTCSSALRWLQLQPQPCSSGTRQPELAAQQGYPSSRKVIPLS